MNNKMGYGGNAPILNPSEIPFPLPVIDFPARLWYNNR